MNGNIQMMQWLQLFKKNLKILKKKQRGSYKELLCQKKLKPSILKFLKPMKCIQPIMNFLCRKDTNLLKLDHGIHVFILKLDYLDLKDLSICQFLQVTEISKCIVKKMVNG